MRSQDIKSIGDCCTRGSIHPESLSVEPLTVYVLISTPEFVLLPGREKIKRYNAQYLIIDTIYVP